MKHALVFLLLSSAAQAQSPLTFKEFEAFVTDRTFTFAVTGEAIYGIEAYGPNRQVIWAELGNICYDGYYEEGPEGEVCFIYPELDDQNCVVFHKVPGGMDGIGWDGTAYQARETAQSMPCVDTLLGS